MFVLRGNPSNMTWNSRQPMPARWVIQLRSLFHEQQQYVGVSDPGGTCKIWCYETRIQQTWKPQRKQIEKKNESRVSLALPLLKTSTFVENWWLEDEIYLEMVTFQVTRWHVNFLGLVQPASPLCFPWTQEDSWVTMPSKLPGRKGRRGTRGGEIRFLLQGFRRSFGCLKIHFNGIFHQKKCIHFGFSPYFWKHPKSRPAETTNLDFRYFFRVRTTNSKNMETLSLIFFSFPMMICIWFVSRCSLPLPGRCGLLQWAWTCGPGVQDTQGTASLRDRCSDTGLFWSSSSLVAWHGHRDFKWWDYNVQESFRML